jgi:hypothetical protein
MVGFNEMHRFYYEFQATCLLVFVILAQLIKPFLFNSMWGVSFAVDFLMKMLGSLIISSLPKSTRILTFIIKILINLQIYRTSLLCIPLTIDANPDEKGCITASKLIKKSEKYCKSYLVSMNRLFCDSHERE